MGKTRDLFKKTGWAQSSKWQGPNRSRRDLEEAAIIHRRTVQKRS